MIEYCIYQRYYNGEPFIIHTFNDFYSTKAKLLDIIQTEIDRNRIFYVDNDFYNNKYQNNLNCKYYCIMCRNITRWKRLEESKEDFTEDKKIIFLDIFNNLVIEIRLK